MRVNGVTAHTIYVFTCHVSPPFCFNAKASLALAAYVSRTGQSPFGHDLLCGVSNTASLVGRERSPIKNKKECGGQSKCDGIFYIREFEMNGLLKVEV